MPEHAERAFRNGAEIYIASVAKSFTGVEMAEKRLAGLAQTHSALVLMANGVGPSEGFVSAGKSSVWNRNGEVAGQLDDVQEGLLILDTATEELLIEVI
jgi:predicted amidohydrolase